ncbi:MAG: 50S ribosomal protein L10 [Nitriliruptoraceae bacterium]
MARPEKVAKVDEVRRELDTAAATLLTHYRGLSVGDLADLRARLRDADAQMRIVKNTLTRRAADAAGMEGLNDLIVGPTSLVFCYEDPVGPAKALKEFQKQHPELVVRGGYLDGEVIDEAAAMRLAELESREELLARLAGLLQGALTQTARLLNAATEKQAKLIQALIDAGGAEGAASTGSAPTAPAEPEPDEAADEPASSEGETDADDASNDAPAED